MSRFIADLDTRDRDARADLHTRLRARRQQLGFSQRAVGAVVGFDPATVRRLERLGVDQSYAATIMRWAEAVHMRLNLETAGFPAPEQPRNGLDALLTAVSSQMTPAAAAGWESQAILAELVRIRRACRIRQRDLAAVLGITDQAVSCIENSGSATVLVALQRHARGIARCAALPEAFLAVNLEEDTQVV